LPIELIEEELGRTGLEDMHIHISRIDYGPGGERRHLNLAGVDLRYVELLQALKDFQAGGLVACESPTLEEDALLLQRTYRGLVRG